MLSFGIFFTTIIKYLLIIDIIIIIAIYMLIYNMHVFYLCEIAFMRLIVRIT